MDISGCVGLSYSLGCLRRAVGVGVPRCMLGHEFFQVSRSYGQLGFRSANCLCSKLIVWGTACCVEEFASL